MTSLGEKNNPALKNLQLLQAPSYGVPAVGALWYKTCMKSSVCPESPALARVGFNTSRPDGFETATDTLNYAVVIEQAEVDTHYKLGAMLRRWRR